MRPVHYLFAILLLSSPAWSATIYVDSNASGADDGTSWTDAYDLFSDAVTAWTTSDVIYVEDSHSESTAATITYTNANATGANLIEIYSVDKTDDSYSIASANQVAVTGSGSDINFQSHFSIRGMRFSAGDNIYPPDAAGRSFRGVDVYFELTGNGSVFAPLDDQAFTILINCTIDFTHASGGAVSPNGAHHWYGVTFAGSAVSGGLIQARTEGGSLICTGCDFSAMTSEIIFDAGNSAGSQFDLYLIASKLPSAVTLHDSGFGTDGATMFVTGTDADGASNGQSFRQEIYTLRGSVKTDTDTYRDSGLQFTEDSANASLKFTPASNVDTFKPMCSFTTEWWINDTGETIFTTEIRENYTTALGDEEFWQEVSYLGTTDSALWTVDVGQDTLANSTLTTSSETWTESMTGDRGAKVATTVTINKAGLYAVRWCLGAYEEGKELYVDPRPTIS